MLLRLGDVTVPSMDIWRCVLGLGSVPCLCSSVRWEPRAASKLSVWISAFISTGHVVITNVRTVSGNSAWFPVFKGDQHLRLAHGSFNFQPCQHMNHENDLCIYLGAQRPSYMPCIIAWSLNSHSLYAKDSYNRRVLKLPSAPGECANLRQ